MGGHASTGGLRPAELVRRLATSPPQPWRHTHEFSPAGETATRVSDTVETPVPARMLRPMFAYRHRQRPPTWPHGGRPATGQTPPHGGGHRVHRTGRDGVVRLPERRRPPRASRWFATRLGDPTNESGGRMTRTPASWPASTRWSTWPAPPSPAGSPLGTTTSPFSPAGPSPPLSSPTWPPNGPAAPKNCHLISASAVGFYGADRGEEILTESSGRGQGFLADVVEVWEAAAKPAVGAGRRVGARCLWAPASCNHLGGRAATGERPLFVAGLGGRLGSG